MQHGSGHAAWTLVLGYTHEKVSYLLQFLFVLFRHNISAKFHHNETNHKSGEKEMIKNSILVKP
jgi:hypothetical protein